MNKYVKRCSLIVLNDVETHLYKGSVYGNSDDGRLTASSKNAMRIAVCGLDVSEMGEVFDETSSRLDNPVYSDSRFKKLLLGVLNQAYENARVDFGVLPCSEERIMTQVSRVGDGFLEYNRRFRSYQLGKDEFFDETEQKHLVDGITDAVRFLAKSGLNMVDAARRIFQYIGSDDGMIVDMVLEGFDEHAEAVVANGFKINDI